MASDIPTNQIPPLDNDEPSVNVEHQVLVESLSFLYRSMPSAAIGHSVAAAFIIVALYEVVDRQSLFIWGGFVVVVAVARLLVTSFVERQILDAPVEKIRQWANMLAGFAFVQTATWGASVFIIWPDDIGYRAVLVTILAGIIAAGGIMLALHRRSFIIYCLPITIPVTIQLVLGGSHLEWILASLMIFYSGLLLVSVNRLTNVFLEGLQMRHLMQTESRTDALTGLANRRGFDESLKHMWQQAVRTDQSVALLMIDVDNFKKYNDYYGHPQGDIALKKTGELLLKVASRSTDVCARIGGEEFAVLMPATELIGSRQVAEAIQTELANARIPHRRSDRGFLTVSIGVNVIQPERTDSMDRFVREADQALYDAKDAGRNCIRIAATPSPEEVEPVS